MRYATLRRLYRLRWVPPLLLGASAGVWAMYAFGAYLFGAADAYRPSRADSQLVHQWRAEHDARRRAEADNFRLRAEAFRARCRAADLEAEGEELRGLLLGRRLGADADRRDRTRIQAEPGPGDLIPGGLGLPTGR